MVPVTQSPPFCLSNPGGQSLLGIQGLQVDPQDQGVLEVLEGLEDVGDRKKHVLFLP